jgi:hypothetical protein
MPDFKKGNLNVAVITTDDCNMQNTLKDKIT